MEINKSLEELITFYREKKLAHAYLISTNNVDKLLKDLLNVIKNIYCEDEFSVNCNKCSLCHLIEIGNLPTLDIIKPDGLMIKKEQILALKRLFSTNSQLTNNKVYIIENAEKMNKESTNTMLKFLEEPADNIYGFFITNNKDNMLDTIISRCQIISCNYDSDSVYEELGLSLDSYQNNLHIIEIFLKEIEKNKNKILNTREFIDYYNNKIDLTIAFKIIFDIYYNLLMSNSVPADFSYLEKQDKNIVLKKTNLIKDCLKKLEYNVNLELLVDKFVIEMSDINESI